MKNTILYILLFCIAESCFSQNQSHSDSLQTIKNLSTLVDKIKNTSQNQNIGLEIDGLLIDESKTKTGKEFYDLFYQQWIAPTNIHNYSIIIKEKPYRLSTTMMEISINETIVFQSLLQPRGDIVEGLVQQALGRTHMYLQNYEDIIRDLDGDERSGNGIY